MNKMSYSQVSPFEPVVLACRCGCTFKGQKRDSHDWIKFHGNCRLDGIKPIRIVSTGSKASRAYGYDDDNRVSNNVLANVDDKITRDENR
jgi:hypothetical protein